MRDVERGKRHGACLFYLLTFLYLNDNMKCNRFDAHGRGVMRASNDVDVCSSVWRLKYGSVGGGCLADSLS